MGERQVLVKVEQIMFSRTVVKVVKLQFQELVALRVAEVE
jgi:hypothetical protein